VIVAHAIGRFECGHLMRAAFDLRQGQTTTRRAAEWAKRWCISDLNVKFGILLLTCT
jgi:hypothetical protein